jgi:hypothetical protein
MNFSTELSIGIKFVILLLLAWQHILTFMLAYPVVRFKYICQTINNNKTKLSLSPIVFKNVACRIRAILDVLNNL